MAQGTRTSTPSGSSRRHGARHGHVVSQVPGRVRVKMRREHRGADNLVAVEMALAGQAGVESVTTNPRTGSVLVHYDHQTLSTDDVTEMLHDIGVVADAVLGGDEVPESLVDDVVEHSSTATGVLGALTDLDRRVSGLTGGRVDLKLLVPAGLGLLGLRQVLTNGFGLAEVPGYVLLWYTFDTFYKLHQRRKHAADHPGEPALSTTSADAPKTGPDGEAPTPATPTVGGRRSRQAGEVRKGRA